MRLAMVEPEPFTTDSVVYIRNANKGILESRVLDVAFTVLNDIGSLPELKLYDIREQIRQRSYHLGLHENVSFVSEVEKRVITTLKNQGWVEKP